MKTLRILLFCLIFNICYLILYKIYILVKSRKYEEDYKNTKINLDRFQLVFVVGVFLVSTYTYKSIFRGAVFGGTAYFIPKLSVKLKASVEKRKILIDLMNVVETLSVQMSSNVPLKYTLKNLSDVCKYSRFKEAIRDLYLEYQLTGFSLTKALNKLKSKFSYAEILMFSSAVDQQVRGGNSEAAYNNLLNILKDKNIEYIESNTESKTTLLIVGVFIILINLLVMGCYPVIVEVNENLNAMLR